VFGSWLTAKLAQNAKLANIADATEQVIAAAQQTVGELQQTVVEGWKAAAEDGKLSQDQIKCLKDDLIFKSWQKLAPSTAKLLEAAKVDVNAIIVGAGEDLINAMHQPLPACA